MIKFDTVILRYGQPKVLTFSFVFWDLRGLLLFTHTLSKNCYKTQMHNLVALQVGIDKNSFVYLGLSTLCNYSQNSFQIFSTNLKKI